MNRMKLTSMAGAVCAIVLIAGVAMAIGSGQRGPRMDGPVCNEPGRTGPGGPGHHPGPPPCEDPIPDDVQAGLLERFGDEGIDADSNGTLTCEEVQAHFEANRPPHHAHRHGPPPCEDTTSDEVQTTQATTQAKTTSGDGGKDTSTKLHRTGK